MKKIDLDYRDSGYKSGSFWRLAGERMNERESETLKLAATILGNISAISFGVALFEHSPLALFCAFIAAAMAFITIRRL